MNISTSVLKRLHVAMFAGATAVFAVASSAHADVIYTNLAATPLSITNSIDGVYLNIVTGVSGSSGAAVPGWDINPYNNNAGLTFYGAASPSGIMATGTPGTTAVATALAFGALISSAGQFNQFQTVGTAFQAEGTNYVGFRFQNEVTGAQNYGWALISSGATAGFPASILGYAYENTGLSITAGQVSAVPEPSTYAMFGLALAGAAGIGSWRRRRQS
ncbi:MAG TPA: PEP-CTERM sorting domain-containing protein [Burkholderiaceae bacterium]